MGRAKLLVDKQELQAEIDKIEAGATFANRNELFLVVAETDWGKGIKNSCGVVKGINPATLNQRVNEFKLTLKTPLGRRGPKKKTEVESKDVQEDEVEEFIPASVSSQFAEEIEI
jgi:hypothetical protein